MTPGEIISLLALILVAIGLFIKMGMDRSCVEVKLTEIKKDLTSIEIETDLKLSAIKQEFLTEQTHRNQIAKVNQDNYLDNMFKLDAKIVANAEDNKEDHLVILVKIDDLTKLFLKKRQ